MGWINGVLAAYALLTIVGGVMGYVSKQSVVSLVAGVGVGMIVLGAVALSKSHPKPAYVICAVVALLTGIRFARSYMETQTPWPHLVVAIASGIVILSVAYAFFTYKQPVA